MQTLSQLGELNIIAHLRKHLRTGEGLITGIGDDCAVVRTTPDAAEDLLLTSDAVIESRHFLPTDPPAAIGRKAISRALSDIAAMGGSPRWALIDLVAPPNLPLATLDELYAAAAERAHAFGLTIVGGDTSAAPLLELHVFAIGTVPRDKAILRSGARPGDAIFVTGSLGGSRFGKHMHFTPRLPEGQWLRDYASAMIDISDGLATDLRHLTTASTCGATLEISQIPISNDAQQMTNDISPLEHALTDGEDFELLFTVPAPKAAALLAAWPFPQTPVTRIGTITAPPNQIQLRDPQGKPSNLEIKGFEHFTTS